jgi:hypothetical protein
MLAAAPVAVFIYAAVVGSYLPESVERRAARDAQEQKIAAEKQAAEARQAYLLNKKDASSNSNYSPKPAPVRTKTFSESVNEKVISDAEEEYDMARSGVDRCVHAGMVAAAHL